MKRLLPLFIFLLIAGLLAFGLKNADQKSLIPSPLINKPAPEFRLPLLGEPEKFVSKSDLLGTTYLLNIWASWCAACRVEHPFLNQLASSGLLPIYGLNWKDPSDDAISWLQALGNPYEIILYDFKGNTAIDFGVYGAPENFIVDTKGQIRYKHVGVLTQQIFDAEVLPILATIKAEEDAQ